MIHGWNEGKAQSLWASASIAPRQFPDQTPTKSPSPSGSMVPNSGRQRIAQACDRCRERKIKCSGERPVCHRCTTRKLNCSYAARGSRFRGSNRNQLVRETSQTSTGTRFPVSPLGSRNPWVAVQGMPQYQYQRNMRNLAPHTSRGAATDGPSQIRAGSSGESGLDILYDALLPQEEPPQRFWKDKFAPTHPEASRVDWHTQPDYHPAADSPIVDFRSSSSNSWEYTSQIEHELVWACPAPNFTLDSSAAWSTMEYEYPSGRGTTPHCASSCGERPLQAPSLPTFTWPASAATKRPNPPCIRGATLPDVKVAGLAHDGRLTYPTLSSFAPVSFGETLSDLGVMGYEQG